MVTSYRIDGTDHVVSVDDAWLAFAAENDAPELTREHVVGRPLWDFVQGSEVRRLLRLVLSRVRRNDVPLLLPFRCDSPDRRRFMRMALTPLPGDELRVDSILERQDRQPPIRLLDRRAPRSAQAPVLCSLCRRVELPGQDRDRDHDWVEVEDAVVRLELFGAGPLPRLAHGVCPGCRGLVRVALAEHGPH